MTSSLHTQTDATETMLHGQLIDGVTEALMKARGPAGRAAVIDALVIELVAAVHWLHGDEAGSNAELGSLQGLVLAAEEHRRQMISGVTQGVYLTRPVS